MLNVFSDFHWPTFFISLILFIVVVNLWILIKAYFFKARAEAKVKKMEKSVEDLLEKLKTEDKKIEGLIQKFKPPSE
jgi:hypothetical protein